MEKGGVPVPSALLHLACFWVASFNSVACQEHLDIYIVMVLQSNYDINRTIMISMPR